MDTQNTPIHIKLWHRDFWLMMFANLCLAIAAYIQVPSLASQMFSAGFPNWQVAVVIGITGLGMFLFGPLCGYWIQRYRRCRVCTYAILGAVACVAGLYQVRLSPGVPTTFPLLCAVRFFFGACYGLAAMVLYSTLIIDMCESFQRTEANYCLAWFSRFALSIGPALSVFAYGLFDYQVVLLLSGVFALVSFVLISVIRFPFLAPYDGVSHFGVDRFLLPGSFPLFANLVLMTTMVGVLLSLPRSASFFALMLVGFALALIAEKYAFANANLKSEVVTGLVVIGAVLLMDIFVADMSLVQLVIRSVLLGFGIGIIGSRFQLFFVKLTKHCQRGTSQSSFLLSWELGIAIGLFIGFLFFDTSAFPVCESAPYALWMNLGLVVLNLLVYNLYTHPWYDKHRNR